MRRFVYAIVRRVKAAAGVGLKSAQRLEGSTFLQLLAPACLVGCGPEDSRSAEDALVRHFAQRTRGKWPGLPGKLTDLRIDLSDMSSEQILARADAALEHDLHPSGVKPAMRHGNLIDWSTNPADSREWLLMLHRHAWWALWAAAYRINGDEKYAEAFVSQITDWIRQNRMPFEKSEHLAPWRLMECGLRLRLSWIPAFGCFYASPAFSDKDKLLVLRAIYDHCNFLATFFTNRNHLVRESNGLLAGAIAFPEFSASESWLEAAIERLDRELQAQVNKDGSHIEMSSGYQWLAIDEFEVTRSLLRPIARNLPGADLGATLERMYTLLAAVMRPDRRFPQLNDGFILWDADRLVEAARDLGRADLEYIASAGAAGEPPAETSQSFPNAGLHIMRSGWEENARYLVFDTGPYGGPHGHEDKLSFELFAFGTPIIVDPGSYTYQPDDPYRKYFVGSQGHNTILVDGASQVRRWNEHHMEPGTSDEVYGEWYCDRDFDWARGSYNEGYAEFSLQAPENSQADFGTTHTREVLFAKPDYWIVVDHLDASSVHPYTALFHLAPGIEVVRREPGHAVLESHQTGTKLLIVPISDVGLQSDVIAGQEMPVQGWYSQDHHKKQPAPTLVFESAIVQSTQFIWVLVPLRRSDDVSSIQVSDVDRSVPGYLSFDLDVRPGTHVSPGKDAIRIRTDPPEKRAGTINITRSGSRAWP